MLEFCLLSDPAIPLGICHPVCKVVVAKMPMTILYAVVKD